MAMISRAEFNIFADYFQICVRDAGAAANAPETITDADIAFRAKFKDRVATIRTERNMDVPVIFECHDSPPDIDLSQADHAIEGPIEILSASIEIFDLMGASSHVFQVPAGNYRICVLFDRLGTIDESGLQGDDLYRLILYPGNAAMPVLLKEYKG